MAGQAENLDYVQIVRELDEFQRTKRHRDFKTNFNLECAFFTRRDHYTENIGWCLPLREEQIPDLLPFLKGTILEIGAGRGHWASLLAHRLESPTTWIATDANPPEKQFYPVELMEAVTAVEKYNPDVLITLWPSYQEDYAYRALRAFKGKTVVYCGEGKGGCCADDQFHVLLEKKWVLKEILDVPRWVGIHDDLYIYAK